MPIAQPTGAPAGQPQAAAGDGQRSQERAAVAGVSGHDATPAKPPPPIHALADPPPPRATNKPAPPGLVELAKVAGPELKAALTNPKMPPAEIMQQDPSLAESLLAKARESKRVYMPRPPSKRRVSQKTSAPPAGEQADAAMGEGSDGEPPPAPPGEPPAGARLPPPPPEASLPRDSPVPGLELQERAAAQAGRGGDDGLTPERTLCS